MPLVSFIVKCFNQSRYIGEAMDGALAQTYRPLEIVVADDASTDDSVKIIRDKLDKAGFKAVVEKVKVGGGGEERIERYSDGDRTAMLILNRHNLGNCGNWQMACSVARGKLFVKADGDDVSLPNRTERVVAEWQKAGANCGVIYHNAFKIDEDGHEIGTADKEIFEIKHTLGAVMACTRACFDAFAGCANPNAYDDIVYHRRALFLGYTEHRFNKKLVKYRIGSGDSTRGKSYFQTMHKNVMISSRSLECAVADLQFLLSQPSQPSQHSQRSQLPAQLAHYNREWHRRLAELPMWESDRFIDRWRSFRSTHPSLAFNRVVAIHLILLLPRRIAKIVLDTIYKFQ